MSQLTTEVLIVGAGPSGLTMGCELMRHGITCRIIEKNTQRSDKSHALGIHARSLEIFEGKFVPDLNVQLAPNGRAI